MLHVMPFCQLAIKDSIEIAHKIILGILNIWALTLMPTCGIFKALNTEQ